MGILKNVFKRDRTTKKVHWSENLEEIRYFKIIVGERGN